MPQLQFVASLVLPVMLLWPAEASGAVLQSRGASEDLFQAQILSCSFPEFASADWNNSTLSTRLKEGQDFTIVFDRIDLEAGTARIRGPFADAAIPVTKGVDSITFLEWTPAGVPFVTTVFIHLDGDLRFAAVHSRHFSMVRPLVSQNYGSCEALG